MTADGLISSISRPRPKRIATLAAVEIELYVEEGDAAVRDGAFDDLLQQIGAALEVD